MPAWCWEGMAGCWLAGAQQPSKAGAMPRGGDEECALHERESRQGDS